MNNEPEKLNYSFLMTEIGGLKAQDEQFMVEFLRLTASVTAMYEMLSLIGEKAGMDRKKIFEELKLAEKKKHQELLLGLENMNPSRAAELDKRSDDEIQEANE